MGEEAARTGGSGGPPRRSYQEFKKSLRAKHEYNHFYYILVIDQIIIICDEMILKIKVSKCLVSN